jgi:hypothetical protein
LEKNKIAFQSVNSFNNTFSNDYRKFKKRELEIKEKKPQDKDDHLFGYLMKKYKEKKVPTSKLYINRNLFEPSILLMKGNEIRDKHKTSHVDFETLTLESKYLNTAENQMVERQGNESKKEMKFKKQAKRPSKSVFITKTSKTLKDEIKRNKDENDQLKETIKQMSFKAVMSRTSFIAKQGKTISDWSGRTGMTTIVNKYKPSSTLLNGSGVMSWKSLENSKSILNYTSNTGNTNSPMRQSSMIKFGTTKRKSLKFAILEASHNKTQSNLTNTTTTLESQVSVDYGSRKTFRIGETKQEILDSLYSKITNRGCIDDEAKEQITNYLKTHTNYLDSKKTPVFKPIEILKNINSIKSKIYEIDVHERYTMLGDKYAKLAATINSNNLNLVKELDRQITNSEVELIKKLNLTK